MGKTVMIDINGNSNVGLYAYATDEYCLLGKGLADEVMDAFKRAFDVPIYEINIGGSQQIGAYLNGNSKCLLVPSLVTQHEIDTLNELGIKFEIVETVNTALGNNLIVGEKHFFYFPGFEPSAVKRVESILGISGTSLFLEDWDVIGSIAVVSSKGGLIQKNVPDEVISLLSEKLDLTFEKGTVNFGSHILGSGIVVNNTGMIIGNASAGIEVTNADLAFGFLES